MTDETKMPDAPAATAQLDMSGGSMPNPSPEGVAALGGDPNMPSEEQKLARAKEGGYVEEPAPSRDERISALIADVEHAMAHNAPMTPAILAEMKALLQG